MESQQSPNYFVFTSPRVALPSRLFLTSTAAILKSALKSFLTVTILQDQIDILESHSNL